MAYIVMQLATIFGMLRGACDTATGGDGSHNRISFGGIVGEM